jgi:hypothetical protein
MLEVMPASTDTFLAVRATEKLTAADYETVFIPELSRRIEAAGSVSTLVYLDEGFEGWELGAMWDDAKFGIQHCRDFDRVAVVGAAAWMEWGAKISGAFMPGEVQTFPMDELEDAIDWARS